MPQHEPPFVAHRGRTSTGVEVISSVPFDQALRGMLDGAKQMVFAQLSGGPEANNAIQAVRAAAENPDAPNHGYAVIMWYLIIYAREIADQFSQQRQQAQGQAGAAAPQPQPGAPGGAAPQQGGAPPQAWGIPGPSVGGMPQPMPQQGMPQGIPRPQGGGAAARSYSRVKSSVPAKGAAVPVGKPGGTRTASGVRLETRVIRGGPAAAPAAAPASGAKE